MTEDYNDEEIQEEIDNTFTNYHQQIKDKNANFRKNLEDKYCKKIFDKLLLEAQLKRQVVRPKFRYNELFNLLKTDMTKPTLDLHLEHLQQKGFITKKSKTKYKTSYQVNVITEPKVIQIRKTFLGKPKLKLVDLSDTKKGAIYFPPNLKLAPESEIPPDKRLHYKD